MVAKGYLLLSAIMMQMMMTTAYNMHPPQQAAAFHYPPDLESLMVAKTGKAQNYKEDNSKNKMMSPPASPEQNRMTGDVLLKLTKPHTTLHRILSGGSQDDQNDAPYFVDKNGVEYEPYSLSWRYLGVYMDCDVDEIGVGGLYNFWDDDDGNWQSGWNGQQEKGDDDTFQWNEDDQVDIDQATDWSRRRRHLMMEYDANNRTTRSRTSQERKLEDYDDCTRKVLWAAYYDPRYNGGSIGEYQYYDFESGTYSKEHCHTRRCRRMDCHEPNTHFKLVGVYKETDGLADFAQQLFKHQGYCLWNEEKYEFMQSYADWWPSYCRQLYYSSYYGGQTLYMDLRPQPEGNITVGIYTDNTCSTPSSYTFGDYIMMYYSYYGNSDAGSQVVETWEYAIQTWNAYMQTYKVCQPCKAYNLYDESYEEGGGSGDNNGRMRFLGENNGDDDGVEEEQWGYNCYDDAGYTNCHQCNKFASQTDMAIATEQDLKRADRQGSILRIKVGRKTYGKGGFRGPPKINYLAWTITGFMMMVVVAGIYTAMHYGYLQNLKGKLSTMRYRVEEWWRGNGESGSNKVSTIRDKVIEGRVKSSDRRKIEYNPPAIKQSNSGSQHNNKATSTKVKEKSKARHAIEKVLHLGRHGSLKMNDKAAPRQGLSMVDHIKPPRSLRNVPAVIDAENEFSRRCRSLDTPKYEMETADPAEQALGLNLSTSRSHELHSRIQEWKSTIEPVERGHSLSTSKSQELQSRIHQWKDATIT